MLDTIEQLDIVGYPQPSSNGRSAIAGALNRVLEAHDEDPGADAYNELLGAIGNNHAGTYFPVVLAVIPILGDVLCVGGSCAQSWVLNVLIDLCGPFVPDFHHRNFRGEPLQKLLIQSVSDLLPIIRSLTVSDRMVAQDAKDLIDLINKRLSEQ